MADYYRMNPAQDILVPGDELQDGMLVLQEQWTMRSPHGYGEEDRRRQQEFREVTRLRRPGHLVLFVGQWADGYQETHTYASDYAWLVKKQGITDDSSDSSEDAEFLQHASREAKIMRRFRVYRPSPPDSYRESGTANPPDEAQFEGVIFTDGTVAVRWLTQYRSHSVWDSWDDLIAVHGHDDYGTEIEWLDPQPLRIKLSTMLEAGEKCE